MRTLNEVIAAHLEAWWRCVHPQPPMGITMTIHECRQCERERDEVAAFLSGPIRGHLVGAIEDLTGPHDEAVAHFRDEVREGYLLAIEEACAAVRDGARGVRCARCDGRGSLTYERPNGGEWSDDCCACGGSGAVRSSTPDQQREGEQ